MSKTVKVRIAVVVGNKGEWNSYGWYKDGSDDIEKMNMAIEGAEFDGERRFWLEADLPLPETPTVKAKVQEAE